MRSSRSIVGEFSIHAQPHDYRQMRGNRGYQLVHEIKSNRREEESASSKRQSQTVSRVFIIFSRFIDRSRSFALGLFVSASLRLASFESCRSPTTHSHVASHFPLRTASDTCRRSRTTKGFLPDSAWADRARRRVDRGRLRPSCWPGK